MPELPAVESFRALAEATAIGRCICTVRCSQGPIVFEGVAPQTISRALRSQRVHGVHRWGKHVWFELDRPPFPVFH